MLIIRRFNVFFFVISSDQLDVAVTLVMKLMGESWARMGDGEKEVRSSTFYFFQYFSFSVIADIIRST
jgi:hypothetical protein